MTQENAIDIAIERILAIGWQLNDSRAASHIALFREYLRRAALWVKALECTDEWPFFDVAAQINPSLRADEAKVESLKRHLTQFHLFRPIKRTCEWFVHWAVVRDTPEVTKFALPDPYEPLILMYERGGDFYTEHGFFNFSVGCFPIGNWSQYYQSSPIIELDEEVLDQLDTKHESAS
jgi:hypothetical protein